MMHGHITVKPHLLLLVMVGRWLSRPDTRGGDRVGRQARGFPDLTRPKSQPKSATLGGCGLANHMMHGHITVKPHLPLLVKVGRWLSRPDTRGGDRVGRQARGFPDLTRPKFQPKSATSGGCRSTNHMMHGHITVKTHLLLLVMVGRWLSRPDTRGGDKVGL